MSNQLLIDINGGNRTLYTKNGRPIAHGFTRVVIGQRGAYVEFEDGHLDLHRLVIPLDQMWRIQDKNWKDKVYFVEYRTEDHTMVYLQKRPVKYADYRISKWYISVWDLFIPEGKEDFALKCIMEGEPTDNDVKWRRK